MTSKDSIMKAVEDFLSSFGVDNCYIGITNNVIRRFTEHSLLAPNKKDPRTTAMRYTSKDAESKANAEAIEDYFVKKYKNRIQGKQGGADDNTKFVYVYLVIDGETKDNV